MKMKFLCVVIGLLLVGCGNSQKTKDSEQQSDTTAPTTSKVEPIENQKINWGYSEEKDEMRGTISSAAFLPSDNTINFSSPYNGGSSLDLVLIKQKNSPIEVAFKISKGQFLCNNPYSGCYATVKFDNGELWQVNMVAPANHASDAVLIRGKNDTEQFVKNIFYSKKMIIELPFYREGATQFKFTLGKPKWSLNELGISANRNSVNDNLPQ